MSVVVSYLLGVFDFWTANGRTRADNLFFFDNLISLFILRVFCTLENDFCVFVSVSMSVHTGVQVHSLSRIPYILSCKSARAFENAPCFY